MTFAELERKNSIVFNDFTDRFLNFSNLYYVLTNCDMVKDCSINDLANHIADIAKLNKDTNIYGDYNGIGRALADELNIRGYNKLHNTQLVSIDYPSNRYRKIISKYIIN